MNVLAAKTQRRLPDNVSGRFFTTDDCDGCAYCASIAPENFDYQKETNTYFVSRQPRTPAEEDEMLEALEDCPVDAIHLDANGDGEAQRETR
jgi:ferredoxin